MIYDTLEHLETYFKGKTGALISEFLKGLSAETPDGKNELDGEDIFAPIATYNTKPADNAFPEAHRKYIDIQLLLSGEELIKVCPIDGLTPREPFDQEKDIVFYETEGTDFTDLKLIPGRFAVFFPQDAHMPGIMTGNSPEQVKKVVIKINADVLA